MSMLWLLGLARHRGFRLLATAAGIALAVGLIAALGTFVSESRSTMTDRARQTAAVDWQVEVQRGANPASVLKELRQGGQVAAVEPVTFAASSGFQSTSGGTTQRTGPGIVLGVSSTYRSSFPDQLRQLTGARSGVLLAQQTAANLHARPGDLVSIGRAGRAPMQVRIDGIVDLPQADTLFQRVGAPTQSQPLAPPDNVILLPEATFQSAFPAGPAVTTQFHVARNEPLPSDPAAAFRIVDATAHNFEARSAGAALVGNNLGAALDAARGDAAYAQMLFLFLGLPGSILAGLLTAAVVGAGATRRRSEQSLLRTRGVSTAAVVRLAAVEAVLVGVAGSVAGLALAAIIGRTVLQGAGSTRPSLVWAGGAVAFGLLVAAATILVPAVRDLRIRTVHEALQQRDPTALPWWLRAGVDVMLLVAALLVFRASSRNGYELVLAPEGVATVSVSYWALLGPALLWLGAAGLLYRVVLTALAHGRRPLGFLLRPMTGRLAQPGAASLIRQHRGLARAIVLLALALSFAASTATFNATYQQQAEADAQLTNGADVTVTEPPLSNVPPSRVGDFAGVPGVISVEPIQHRFAYVGADLQDLYGVRPATISGVTALEDGYFVGGTASQLMAKLASRPDSILVSSETVKDFQLADGDLIKLRLQDAKTRQLRTVPFHFAGVVKEFPTAPKDSFFVANAAYVAQATKSDSIGAFLVDTGGSGQRQVAEELRRRLGTSATVTDITQARGQVGSSLTSVDLQGLTRLELVFAVFLAVAAGGLVLAIGLAERRRTLAIMSVLGARRSQLRGLVAAEGLLIIVGGTLGGIAMGTALSRMLVKVLTGVFDPPPSSIAVPWSYFAVTGTAVAAALFAAVLVGARASTRPAVEELRDI